MRLHFRAFFLRRSILPPVCLALNNLVRGFLFGGREMNDTEYMRLALEHGEKRMRMDIPNPMVGAVIVKDGQIIGQGWHERYGQPHAERNALASCAVDPRRGNDVCDAGALLSFWKTAAVCECYSGSGHQPGRSGVGRPKPTGVGKRNCCSAGAGSSGDGRRFAGRMRRTQSDILPFYNDKTPVCFYEVCHDNGRKKLPQLRAHPNGLRVKLPERMFNNSGIVSAESWSVSEPFLPMIPY